MKRILILLLISTSIAINAKAQNYVTARLGVALANQTNTLGSIRPGWMLGLGYEYQIADEWWLFSGFDYTIKGTSIGTILNNTQFGRRVSYIDIPLHAKYKYYVNETFHWAIVGGANIGITQSAENRFFRIAQPTVQELPLDDISGAKPIDLSLTIGGELNFATDYGQIGLFAAFQPSIGTSVTLVQGDASGITGDLTNVVISAGLNFKFGKQLIFKKKKEARAQRSSR